MRSIITGEWAAKHSDAALLFLRVATGLVFFMHGWQKWEGGLTGVTAFLTSLQFPMPALFAVLLVGTEVVGGAALILGAFTRLAAKFTAIVAFVALLTVHVGKGFFIQNGGYEFILLLLAASLMILVVGPGSWSADKKFLKM
jgi:putative oxidoreductase